MSKPESEHDSVSVSRRELLNALAASGGVLATRLLLPAVWSTPVVLAHALPAHAQMSCQVPSNYTRVYPQPISSSVAQDKVKLTIQVPLQVITHPTQFHVLERFPGGSDARVVGLMTPSTDSQMSGTFEIQLTRPAGTYQYQLCWSDGVSDWLNVEVAP